MSGLWPEGGGGEDPWVAFLALEVEAASPGGERTGGGGVGLLVGENISGKRQTYLCLCLCVCT